MASFARIIGCCTTILILLASTAHSQETPTKKGVEGIWLGSLSAAGVELRLAFHVTSKEGKLAATMDSIDQGVKGLAMSDVTFKDDVLHMEVKAVGSTNGT